MIRATGQRAIATALVALTLSGCAGTGLEPLQLHSIQTLVLDTTDRKQTLRAIVTTLRELGFVLESANTARGTVSALRVGIESRGLDGDGVLRISVSVRLVGQTQLQIQANARYGLALQSRHGDLNRPAVIKDPRPYRRFFRALERAMTLDAHAL